MGPSSFQCCAVAEQGAIGTKSNMECSIRTQEKNYFTVRVTEPWNRLPREAVESPLEIFRTPLDAFLCNLL